MRFLADLFVDQKRNTYPPWDRHNGAPSEVGRECFRIQGRTHQHKFQTLSPSQQVLDNDEQEVSVQVSFMYLCTKRRIVYERHWLETIKRNRQT